MGNKIRHVSIAALVFAAITALFFREVIWSNNILFFRDLGRYYYPLREFSAALIRHGDMPLWNPYIFCGNPLLACLQSAVFYPPSILYLFGDFGKAFNNFIILHYTIAGIFMYIFLSGEKLSKTSSFIGAVTFGFSGYLLATANVLSFLSSAVWFPIVVWSFFRAIERGGYRHIILTALFLLLMYLAGEPMVLYMTGFIMACVGVKKPKIVLSIFALFLLFSAYQLLPMLELLVKTDRMSFSYAYASKWSMAPYDLLNTAFPFVTDVDSVFRTYWQKQNWALSYYFGLFPLLMIPFAVVCVKGRKKGAIFSLLAVSLVLSLGSVTPVYRLLFKFVPAFRLFRYPVKYYFLTVFSMSWIAALAFDCYERRAKTDARLMRIVTSLLYLTLAMSFVLLMVDLYFYTWAALVHHTFFETVEKAMKKGGETLPYIRLSVFTIRRTLIFFALFVTALYLGTKRRVAVRAVSVFIGALIVADLYSASYTTNFFCDAAIFKKPSPAITFLMHDKSLFRIASSPAALYQADHPTKEMSADMVEAAKEMLFPNRMIEYGIYDIDGYEGATRTRMCDIKLLLLTCVKDPGDSRLLDILNVKYIVSPKDFSANGYVLVKESPIARLYENKNVLPRAYLSEKALVIKDKRKILEKFLDKDWDPRAEVVLEEEPGQGLGSRVSGHVRSGLGSRVSGLVEENKEVAETDTQYAIRNTQYERVDITKYTPNEVIIRATTNATKFLVLSDSYYPGWKAYVDGKREKIYCANYVVRAVRLEPGAHDVRFVYDPLSFKIGLVITLAGFLLVLIYIVKNMA